MSKTTGRRAEEFTLQTATGSISSAVAPTGRDTISMGKAVIALDITTLTLANADHELDFYVQTTYGSTTNWVDCQNFHFTNSDNGATAKKIALVDGTLDGPGSVKSITGTNPAAGTEISETVPANTVWKPISISYSLVTATTAANRFPQPVFDDGTNAFYAPPVQAAQAANKTYTYNVASVNLVQSTSGINSNVPMPEIYLSAGYRFRTNTSGIQAEDDFSAPQMLVEEWHDPQVLTDGTIRDDVKSYERPLGSKIRVKTALTGTTTTIAYAFSAKAYISE